MLEGRPCCPSAMVEEGGGRGQEPELLSPVDQGGALACSASRVQRPCRGCSGSKKTFPDAEQRVAEGQQCQRQEADSTQGEGDRAGPCDVGLEGPQRNQGWLWGFESPHLGRGARVQGNGKGRVKGQMSGAVWGPRKMAQLLSRRLRSQHNVPRLPPPQASLPHHLSAPSMLSCCVFSPCTRRECDGGRGWSWGHSSSFWEA